LSTINNNLKKEKDVLPVILELILGMSKTMPGSTLILVRFTQSKNLVA